MEGVIEQIPVDKSGTLKDLKELNRDLREKLAERMADDGKFEEQVGKIKSLLDQSLDGKEEGYDRARRLCTAWRMFEELGNTERGSRSREFCLNEKAIDAAEEQIRGFKRQL